MKVLEISESKQKPAIERPLAIASRQNQKTKPNQPRPRKPTLKVGRNIDGFKRCFIWGLPKNYQAQKRDKTDSLSRFFQTNFGEAPNRFDFKCRGDTLCYVSFNKPETLDRMFESLEYEDEGRMLKPGDMSKYYKINLPNLCRWPIKIHRCFSRVQNLNDLAKCSKIIRLGQKNERVLRANAEDDRLEEISNFFNTNCGQVIDIKFAEIRSQCWIFVEFEHPDQADKAVLIGDPSCLVLEGQPCFTVDKEFELTSLDDLNESQETLDASGNETFTSSPTRNANASTYQPTWTGLNANNKRTRLTIDEIRNAPYFGSAPRDINHNQSIGESLGLNSQEQMFQKRAKLERDSQENEEPTANLNQSQVNVTIKREIETTKSQDCTETTITREERSFAFEPNQPLDLAFVGASAALPEFSAPLRSS